MPIRRTRRMMWTSVRAGFLVEASADVDPDDVGGDIKVNEGD